MTKFWLRKRKLDTEEGSPPARINPHDTLDAASKSVAGGTSRRELIRLAFTGVMAVAFTYVGIRPAWAATECTCGGAPLPAGQQCCQVNGVERAYDPATRCCTSFGIQQKHPIVNLAACPNKVPHPGHVPGDDGTCTGVPDNFGSANFLPCCLDHDHCYDTCNSPKAGCDNAFLACLNGRCDAAYAPGRLRNLCRSVASTYYTGVSNIDRFYDAAQREACDCCSGDSPCCPSGRVMCGTLCCDAGERCVNGQCQPAGCSPGTCGTFQNFSCGGDCYCFPVAGGGGACSANFLCSSTARCSSNAQCGPGSVCAVNTCCGAQGYCTPRCGSKNPVPLRKPGSGPSAAGTS